MSGSQSSPDVFDMRKVRKLIELMKEHDLTEIDLKQADSAVRITHMPSGVVVFVRKESVKGLLSLLASTFSRLLLLSSSLSFCWIVETSIRQ